MAKLAPTQAEQLQSIGAYLREVRQHQGLALDLLASQIFIRPALLQALESGQGGELPEPVFIQGFIRRYAEALGLDGAAISQEFQVTPVEVPSAPDPLGPGNSQDVVEPEGHHSVGVLEKMPPVPVSRPRPDRERSPLPLVLGLAALTVVLGLVTWGLWGRSGDPLQATIDSPTAATPPSDASPEADASGAAPTDPEEAEAAPETTAAALPEAPVVVNASLRDRAWLSVVADGRNVYEGTAERGFQQTWTAQTSIVFRTGNAGGVELSVNGDRAAVMGNSGVVRTLTVTPDSGVASVQSP